MFTYLADFVKADQNRKRARKQTHFRRTLEVCHVSVLDVKDSSDVKQASVSTPFPLDAY